MKYQRLVLNRSDRIPLSVTLFAAEHVIVFACGTQQTVVQRTLVEPKQ